MASSNSVVFNTCVEDMMVSEILSMYDTILQERNDPSGNE